MSRFQPAFLLLAAPFVGMGLQAAERHFAYTYESAVLAPGGQELEIWNTYRSGRETGHYRALDTRIEFELGVAQNLQTAFYLNVGSTTAGGTSETELKGFSWEWKYKLSDPVADAFGQAIYAEVGVGDHEQELELKYIVDKVVADRWILAADVVYELEFEEENDGTNYERKTEHVLAIDMGVAYQLSPVWSIGLELHQKNVVEEGEWEYAPLFLGPVVHFSNENFWATLSVLPQITNLGGEADVGERELTGNEKVEARLIFGFHL